jgi:mono/diheme cytochrome c family protein
MLPFRLSRKWVRLGLALIVVGCGAVPGRAQDGAALYKSKCLVCHGATGSGKASLPGTNLLADAGRKASDAELTEAIAQGGQKKLASHAFANKGMKPAEIQALVGTIRTLQSKQKS